MKNYFHFLCFILLFSCSESLQETNTCNVNNPIEELVWLKKIKYNSLLSSVYQKVKITQYTYKNESVFLIDNCVGCSDNLTSLYNCEGKIICEFGGIAGINTCPDFEKEATNKIIVWEN